MPKRRRTRPISRSSMVVTSSPKIFTDPEVGFIEPIICRSSVLLPQPLPPMITSVSPRWTLKEISSITARSPNFRTRSTTSMMGSPLEFMRQSAYGPAAKNADVISHDREGGQHHEHGEKAWHHQILDWINRHYFQRLDLLRYFHRAQFRGDSGAAATDHDYRDQDWPHLAQERDHHQVGDIYFRAELLERMRCLHGERHTYAKRRQRDHRRRAHTDEHHLPEDGRDFEKLSGKRRDQNPIEQADIKLEIVFQNAVMRTRRMTRGAQ